MQYLSAVRTGFHLVLCQVKKALSTENLFTALAFLGFDHYLVANLADEIVRDCLLEVRLASNVSELFILGL